jgi:hypothetical protein
MANLQDMPPEVATLVLALCLCDRCVCPRERHQTGVRGGQNCGPEG